MKVLTFTSLYPNAVMPSHGVFVENRLRHLVESGRIESRVVAPVPWFPFTSAVFGRYADFARVPERETLHGIEVAHPRFPHVPGIGMYSAPGSMAIAARPAIARLIREGYDFDAIDAHYFYPDGVAAALLARWFDRPLIVTARGSDVTQLPEHALPRRQILWAARQAAAIITVCAALKDELVRLGADARKITVLRNGVDLERFAPLDREAACRSLSARFGGALLAQGTSRLIASVGHLIVRKGHELVIDALAAVPSATLVVAGSGPERASLEARARRAGVDARVRFTGQLRHAELQTLYAASDALVLASSNEGWANVLLEAMACGTPVVASDVGGSREVVTAPEAGVLLAERTAPAIASALTGLLADRPSRDATRRYAERFSWDETTHGQERIFESLREPAADLVGETP